MTGPRERSVTVCVRGCTGTGHAPPCACTPDCPAHAQHCTGCRPRDAEHGLLCRACYGRLRALLGGDEPDRHGLPWAWAHIYDALIPSGTALPGGAPGSRPPLSVAVLALRDDIRDTLASWTADVMDRWRLAGPPGVHAYTDRPPVGPPGMTPNARDRLIVIRCATWLLAHAEPFAAHEAITYAYDELTRLMVQAHAVAPWRPAPTLLDGIPCRCMATALHDHGPDGVTCWRCGATYDRDAYTRLVKVLDHRARTDPALMATAAQKGWRE